LCAITFNYEIRSGDEHNDCSQLRFIAAPDNDLGLHELSPSCPQDFVDNLWIKFAVGTPQREEIEQRRGFP
jgi:hypothetical protein